MNELACLYELACTQQEQQHTMVWLQWWAAASSPRDATQKLHGEEEVFFDRHTGLS